MHLYAVPLFHLSFYKSSVYITIPLQGYTRAYETNRVLTPGKTGTSIPLYILSNLSITRVNPSMVPVWLQSVSGCFLLDTFLTISSLYALCMHLSKS